MPSGYYLELNMRTGAGFERFGRFDLGEDRAFAVALFSGLEGEPVDGDTGILHMDLVEKRQGLPMNMQVINCTVEELSRNMKHITREIFKHLNLGEMPASD